MTIEDDERLRLREYQLDYLRAELLRLVRERDEMVYSASWLLFKPMRRAEAALVRKVTGLYRRFVPQKAPVAATPVSTPTPAPARGESLAPRRLLVDVTGTIKCDAGTGIQRVVKKVVEALYGGETYEIPA
ncbi:MAG TPA: glycosyltransferase family 1 protein, partial [Methylocystis sp.]|nr:glycosyltransferase family 1 protein [Methylocystis sp.]